MALEQACDSAGNNSGGNRVGRPTIDSSTGQRLRLLITQSSNVEQRPEEEHELALAGKQNELAA